MQATNIHYTVPCAALLLVSQFLPVTVFATGSQTSCEALTGNAVPNGLISLSEWVAAGNFNPPGADSPSPQFQNLPAFCRVSITLAPSSDSDIKVEVWLPADDWNEKYQAVGNGAFNGSISYPAMANALSRGYATSSTDTGHTGNNALFGLGHPEKVIDFGWRAVHEMSVSAKQVINSFYQQEPEYSYWNGCSAGGRQAMKEAQRFPQDFDGIIAGAPGLDWTGRAVAALRIARHLTMNPDARLSEQQRQMVAELSVSSCDAADGVRDGIIGKPLQCKIDPAVLLCGSNSSQSCLSPLQAETVNMIYSSPLNPASGRAIAGLVPGSELGWTDLGWTGSARATGLDQLRYLVYGDANWTVEQFNFDTDVVRAEAMDNDTLNALDADLSDYFSAGGKLIQYHGWSDPQISPLNSVQYYQRVLDQLGGREAVHDSYRLFMAPGMGHCSGGVGPDRFDAVSALENWVENGVAPDAIIAARRSDNGTDMTRPLCPWPEEAVYTGSGSSDSAENFVCRAP